MTKVAALVIVSFFATQCVKKASKKNDTEDPVGKNAGQGSEIQLKGAALLYQALYRTLGPNKEKLPPKAGNGGPENVFDTYASNFGNTEGLRFGEIYPDSPSASYFLALSIMADNAAKRCQEELLDKPGTSLCKCDTPESAKALVVRALPSTPLDDERGKTLVQQFQDRCKQDYSGALTALLSSLAFAVKR